MFKVELAGNYYEMGYQFGTFIKDRALSPRPSPHKLSFALECEPNLRLNVPGLLEELQGVSDASGLDYGVLLAAYCTPYFLRGCNVFAISGAFTEHQRPIFARNLDWLVTDLARFHLYITRPNEG